MKSQKVQIANLTFGKKNRAGGITLPDFKIFYNTTIYFF